MGASLAPDPMFRAYGNNNNPLAGGQLYTYQAGTTTPAATYTDSTGNTPNSNPVVLNARGEAPVWLSPTQAYKLVLRDSSGNLIWTVDQVTSPAPVAVGNMTDEKGSDGNPGFKAGTDFTPGTTTSLPLSTNYGSASNLWVAFDAAEQGADSYSLSGTTLTFNAPIPNGTNKVFVKGGTALTVGSPGSGSVTDASVAANAGINSSKLSYLAPYAGAQSRTVLSKLSDFVSILDFPGADPTGVNDSTAAMNAAHATGKIVLYPSGTYKFSTLNPIASGGIIGQGRQATTLKSTDMTTANLIVFNNSSSTPILRDFTLAAPASGNLPVKTAGAGIQFNPASGEISYAHFDNVTITWLPICVDTVAASYWTMNNCEFLSYSIAGVQVANTNNADSGDSTIQGCLFNTPGTAGVGVLQKSSGGLKVIGNKFLGGLNGYQLNFNGAANTSDLLFVGNSIENMSAQAIALSRQSGTFNFSNLLFVGNEFAVETTGLQTDASNFLSELIVQGNVLNLSSGAGYGVNLATVTDFFIGGNTFKGNGGTPNGIMIAASCSNGKIGKNTYSSLSSTLVNSSATTNYEPDVQRGLAITSNSGWSGYGPIFAGPSTSVTFPQAYTLAPSSNDITLTPAGANGEVGGIVTNVTTTGFTFRPISAVNGISANISWVCNGGVI